MLFLTILFNHLLSGSYYPVAWKHSVVTPIPKAGRDIAMVSSWRPISILNCVSKIFERILATRLVKHIDRLDIFPDQFGFLRGHTRAELSALGHL